MVSLEQSFWRDGVMRSSNQQLSEALTAISNSLQGSTLTEYPEPEFILKEAAWRLLHGQLGQLNKHASL